MADLAQIPRSLQRLAEELEEDGVELVDGGEAAAVVLEELDYCRRIPMFEGRRPVYGAIVATGPVTLDSGDLDLDVVDVAHDLDQARPYADGRSSYLLRRVDASGEGALALACFDRSLQYEADLVRAQEATGVSVVQRTPMLGVTRLFQAGSVVSWDGRSWSSRPTASSLLPTLERHATGVDHRVAGAALELALHWLSPARVGATFVVCDEFDKASFDKTGATEPPGLTLANRRHFPPIMSCLMQRDLATVVDGTGAVRAVGVGLRASAAADAEVSHPRGMRHRSAQRWSFDHPEAVVVVVSEDGPVTVFAAGEAVIGGVEPPAG
jgi:DNA integrity scanning protein DisA with diadenylate cyclase activity